MEFNHSQQENFEIMTKICTCEAQNSVPLNKAVDFINREGKIVARYNKDCSLHGYKLEKETNNANNLSKKDL